MRFMSVRIVAAAVCGLMLMPGLVSAESYSNLVKQGYKTGKLSQNRAGLQGWVVSKGDKQFFCQLNVGVVYNGKDKMAAFTSAGRIIPIDKRTYERAIGGPDPSLANLVDLRAGRPRPRDAGSCSPRRK